MLSAVKLIVNIRTQYSRIIISRNYKVQSVKIHVNREFELIIFWGVKGLHPPQSPYTVPVYCPRTVRVRILTINDDYNTYWYYYIYKKFWDVNETSSLPSRSVSLEYGYPFRTIGSVLNILAHETNRFYNSLSSRYSMFISRYFRKIWVNIWLFDISRFLSGFVDA